MSVILTGNDLTLIELSRIVFAREKIELHPDSIPTSANQEDHVSMGTIGAMKARTIIDNVSIVFAIELMIACQVLDCRKINSSPAIEAVKNEIRKTVKHLDYDRIMTNDINSLTKIIDSDIIPGIVKNFIELK